ncbi:MAG: YopX family protein [Muribaculaceae bacterium]
MRAIRFRGKDDNGKWAYGFLSMENMMLQIQGSDIYRDGNDSFQKQFVDPQTVGQYIGQLDIMGNEIYEGDIIVYAYSSLFTNAIVEDTLKVVVKYCSQCAGFVGNNGFSESSLPHMGRTKILGNIYDNKELLK